ncbi:hypothetical protein [Paenibacillus larvae]|uniref:hypothetical protein n=1 Tax=Paenibacillus larvae TaxID=1464 RepID=UPI00288D2B57|nr:hypothetical protein [Paenibacillus larvae]MDT2192379.1 hypothetical protein [Paenibacillus larvae]MDT2239679.1 hypothetical protein [Paenibacillus larvae]MDT2246326.1 hypothetical protein [Paenibacillus larvae]MDT2259306.1 hypothetical protein [Paenibacillus larvae]MDT2263378.1 hypothetical protein [Paenibacillus larvae]
MIEIIISLVVLVLTGYLIAKNYDAKVVLLAAGLVLLFPRRYSDTRSFRISWLPVPFGWIRLNKLKRFSSNSSGQPD